jgi:gliding motility-associated protein GldM
MGGAKNCPETPRQKMISMMYLVLTAMLALNVSAAILNGYAQVDDSLHATIATMDEGNRKTYHDFKLALAQNQEKVKPWYDSAMLVQTKSQEFYEYVQNFKDEMVALAEGAKATKNAKVRDLGKQDDTNIPQQYGLNEGNALILKQKIEEYRDFMIRVTGNEDAMLNREFIETFSTPMGVNAEGDSISWENSIFYEMPMCATVTVLTKLQNDIRHCEGRAVRYLLTQTDASDLRVNKFDAHIIPSSDYVIQGSKYRAKVVLAAMDSTQAPEFYVNGSRIGGNGIYEVVASSVGRKKVTGQVRYMDKSGQMQSLPFEREYTVGAPSATVSNKDLNILFRNYPNKFSVSVPGVSDQDVTLSASGASVSRSGSDWIVSPGGGSTVTISVHAKMEGSSRLMGSYEYRVKSLPSPVACFEVNGNPIKDGKISMGALTNPSNKLAANVDAVVPVQWSITSFQVKLPNGQTISVNGSRLNDAAISAIRSLRQGSTVSFVNIKASGAGRTENLYPLALELR